MTKDLVSIGIPAYKATYLKEAIDSVLNQTYTKFELIIVNDKSPENIEEIISTYNDKRIRYYKNEDNLGKTSIVLNWNKCLSYANGDFFVLLCDDDIMLPNFIATMLGLVKSHPQCNVFKTRTLLIDSKTNTNIGKSPLFPKYETFADFLSNTIIGKRKHTISEFFYRTQHIQQLGGYQIYPAGYYADDASILLFCNNNHTEKEYRKNNLINMSNIKDNLLQLIGKTPLVRLSNIYKDEYGTEIIAKVEYFNPGGSVKDRAAYAMIEAAETSGKLKKDGTIIEPTSGNTGIGMAWIAALKGYKVILTMPETMSIERRKLLKAFGSELVLTPGSEGMKGAIAKAEELNSQIKGSVILQQFKNPANPDIHYMTTANEIIEDAGKFDVFISCVGTGGSITGIGKRLKEKSPEIEIIAVEPKGSPVLSGGVAGPHKIQGIGAGFIPEIIERSYIDKIIQINDNDAFKMMRDLARKEGLLVGISSGAAVSVAVQVAQNCNYKGKRIVVLLPDTGERYLSMNIASIHDLEDY